jgi:anti-sigma regulatory factor (Ser/Thr protein kinase)
VDEFVADPNSDDWASASFEAADDAAARARRALPHLLGELGLHSGWSCDLELLISELVTNAVRHSGSDEVRVSIRRGDPLRVLVSDQGDGMPLVTEREIGGWGLRLVEALSIGWGVVPLATGKVVWFDLEPDATHEVGEPER